MTNALETLKGQVQEHVRRPLKVPADVWQAGWDALPEDKRYRSLSLTEPNYLIGGVPIVRE
jgi:hypothetical protein